MQARKNQDLYYKLKKYVSTIENVSFVDGKAQITDFPIYPGWLSSKIIQIDFVNSNNIISYSFIGELKHSQFGPTQVDRYTYFGKHEDPNYDISLISEEGYLENFLFSHSHPSANHTFVTNLVFYEIE